MSQIRVDDIVDAAGTAGVAFTQGIKGDVGIKGWINYTFTGTINDSFNVSSLTDVGTGIQTVVWDTDFANANYAVVATPASTSSLIAGASISSGDKAVGSTKITTIRCDTGAAIDATNTSAIAFGDQ